MKIRRNGDSAFVELLKMCGRKQDLCEGIRLHTEIQGKGLIQKNPYIASTLISMYAQCRVFGEAKRILREFTLHDLASWNALIAGYVQHQRGYEAVNCFHEMLMEGLYPNWITFISVLKACGNTGTIDNGRNIHNDIIARGLLEKNIILGNALVDMYAKCGILSEAQQVLQGLPGRNVVTWSALIAGYAQNGQGTQALNCFEQMQGEGLSPNEVTFVCILKACSSIGALDKGKKIHSEIAGRGLLEKSVAIGNALVDMYAKCGLLTKAQEVLQLLPIGDVITWNSLISGYVQWGRGREALRCLEKMQRMSISPDKVTFICILKACGNIRAIDEGRRRHDEIVNKGFLGNNIVLGNALVDMYAKCGNFLEAQQLLDELPVRNVVCWSALISGYTKVGKNHEALNCFEQMLNEGLCPNDITFISLLKACISVGAVDKGKKIHDEIISRGLLESNCTLGNVLVDMYVKFGFLMKALQVLERLPHRNVVSWNSLISGYAELHLGQEALDCFDKMQSDGLSPNEVTFISILKACGSIGAIREGRKIHNEIVNNGLLQKSTLIGNALVDMYAKCGLLTKAADVLEKLPVRNVISWNTLITGYTQMELGHKAMICFEQLQMEGLTPDDITFTCIMKACSSSGAIDMGKRIHDTIVKQNLLEKSVVLGNALVDMYAKCGAFAKAEEVLRGFCRRDKVSWSAIIAGYAQKGRWFEALDCFEKMQREGLAPNEVTLLSILDACSHSGKLDKAEEFYENMKRRYGIEPKSEHQACMVVGFGCAGHFEKALSVIKTTPYFADPSVWFRLLGACAKWGNVELGRLVFDQAILLGNNQAAAYMLMANIYGTAGMQEDIANVMASWEKTYKAKYVSPWNHGFH